MTDTLLSAYVDYWQTLTPQSVPQLRTLVTPDFHFRDPFHDIIGLPAAEAMLQRMFQRLDAVRSEMLDCAHGQHAVYLRWRFTATHRGKPLVLDGMTELLRTEQGLIRAHLDHWDASRQVYEGVPVLGAAIRLCRRFAS
ncbi:MAG: nuclear transport factor 2 family protein [Alphaproteobacteria bacterium]|nr:MAG: nuclear transport factor 2 family protein [Alphaproteobacteria bacterium]